MLRLRRMIAPVYALPRRQRRRFCAMPVDAGRHITPLPPPVSRCQDVDMICFATYAPRRALLRFRYAPLLSIDYAISAHFAVADARLKRERMPSPYWRDAATPLTPAIASFFISLSRHAMPPMRLFITLDATPLRLAIRAADARRRRRLLRWHAAYAIFVTPAEDITQRIDIETWRGNIYQYE